MTTRLDAVLTEVQANVFDEFVATSEHASTAMTLISAVQHAVQSFYTVPHMAWISASAEGSSGKSLAMMLVANLGPNPIDGSDTTSYALGSSLNQAQMAGKPYPTLHFDELSTITGNSGMRGAQHFIPKHIRRAYKKGAKGSVSRGDVAVEWEIFGICLMTGLVTCLPRDIARRTIRIWMAEAAPPVEYRARRHDPIVHSYRDALKAAVRPHADMLEAYWPGSIHPKLVGRLAEIWEPMFAVATVAGGDWPAKCLSAFMALGIDESDRIEPTPDERTVLDVAAYLPVGPRVFSRDVLAELRRLSAYQSFSNRDMARLLTRVLGETHDIRVGSQVLKGWDTAGIRDHAAGIELALTVDGGDLATETDSMFDVADVAEL